jgi:hypothetical protein
MIYNKQKASLDSIEIYTAVKISKIIRKKLGCELDLESSYFGHMTINYLHHYKQLTAIASCEQLTTICIESLQYQITLAILNLL